MQLGSTQWVPEGEKMEGQSSEGEKMEGQSSEGCHGGGTAGSLLQGQGDAPSTDQDRETPLELSQHPKAGQEPGQPGQGWARGSRGALLPQPGRGAGTAAPPPLLLHPAGS